MQSRRYSNEKVLELGGDLYLINGNMTKLADAGLFAARTATTTETTNTREAHK